MINEENRLAEMMRNLDKANNIASQLVLDKKTKKIRESTPWDNPNDVVVAGAQDLMFGT